MTTWTADDGTELYFESFGGREKNKPVLFMLPGLLGAIRTQWRNFVQPMTADFRVILVDLRGHGRSTNAANNLRPERMAEDIFGLMDELNIEQANILGHSIGGYIGLVMAYQQPMRVKTVTAHATKFYWTADAVEKMNAQLDPDIMADKAPTYADMLVQDHGARQWRFLVRQAAEMVHYLKDNGVTEAMAKKIQCPILISIGDRDEVINLLEAQRLSLILPKGELIVLPGVRHPYQTLLYMPILPMVRHFCLNN